MFTTSSIIFLSLSCHTRQCSMHMQRVENTTTPPTSISKPKSQVKKQCTRSSYSRPMNSAKTVVVLFASASASHGVIFGHLLIFIHPRSACLLACLIRLVLLRGI
ncbi:hypothetical protein BDW68DRAFT_78319 [Aspergillus falconensis]